jgi:hypothetical protein
MLLIETNTLILYYSMCNNENDTNLQRICQITQEKSWNSNYTTDTWHKDLFSQFFFFNILQ